MRADVRRAYFRDWYRKNVDRYRPYYSRKAKEYREAKRTKAIDALGGKCQRCGFADPRALQFDHVAGNGTKDRLTSGQHPSRVLRELKTHPGKYQLLCANCNWIKRYERQEHC